MRVCHCALNADRVLVVFFKVSAMGPCHGPLLDSGGVCSMGTYFVCGILSARKNSRLGVHIGGL